jgi:hypothetical protein
LRENRRNTPAERRGGVWDAAHYSKSSYEDDKGQDPENQLRQLREWRGHMGYPIVHEYVEHKNGGEGLEYR